MSSLASPVLRLGSAGTPQPPQYLSEKYEFGRRLGGGAFGDVWLARERAGSGSLRAIKHIKQKYNRWEECLKLRECKALSSLPPHRNVVRLFQLIHAKPQLDLYFVMEYCPRDLHQLTRRAATTAALLTCRRLLRYARPCPRKHLHRHGFFHRHQARESARSRAAKIRARGLPPELSIGRSNSQTLVRPARFVLDLHSPTMSPPVGTAHLRSWRVVGCTTRRSIFGVLGV